MYNFLPKGRGINILYYCGIVAVNGVLLAIGRTFNSAAHKFIVNLHTDVRARHLSFRHLGINEGFRIGMLDTNGKHQRTATAVLCHLARTIAETLHEGHQTCGGQCGVLHGRTLRTYLREVVAHTAATLHQLHLLFVFLHDCTIGVGIAIKADDKAVAQRSYLIIIADTRHRAACGHNIAEVVKKVEHILRTHRIGILVLNTRNLICQAPVHIDRRLLKDIPKGILHGILVHPHAGSQLIAIEISQRGLKRLIIRVNFSFHSC